MDFVIFCVVLSVWNFVGFLFFDLLGIWDDVTELLIVGSWDGLTILEV